jgi:fatty-acyl-CoA synthase
MNSPLTPLEFLARSATVYRDAIAVVDGERRFTYAQFHARVSRLSSALAGLGVGPGDRVAVLAANGTMPL